MLKDEILDFEISSLPYMKELNHNQKKAVISTEGYVRVIAGAGTGKTKALISRYLYLVDYLKVPMRNILCVTFTNKAAQEMKKRIQNYTDDHDLGYICTFHGFCRKFLHEEFRYLHFPKNFMIIDNEDKKVILKNVIEDLDLDKNRYSITYCNELIQEFKRTTGYEVFLTSNKSKELIQKVNKYKQNKEYDKAIGYRYLYEQLKILALDFDDLIILTLHILQNYEEVKEKWARKLQYIMVDEFQDVSSRQYQLVERLASYHHNLFVVGDPDQTIYSWRGADIHFIMDFVRVHENVIDVVFDDNYRSTNNILEASNSLIQNNTNRIKKELHSFNNRYSTKVIYNHLKNDVEQSKWIVQQIQKLYENQYHYSNIAILYRAHYCSRAIEEQLLRNNIPYIIYSGVSFYERREIKDVLSYLRFIVYQDDLSFLRIINTPRRNFGNKRMEIIQQYAAKKEISLYESLLENLDHELIKQSKANEFVELIEKYKKNYHDIKITDLLASILIETKYETILREQGDNERIENIEELKKSIYDFENNSEEDTYLEDYLQNITLLTNVDRKEKRQDLIKLMTIHNAKGTEYDCVFIKDLNEGIFPSSQVHSLEEMEEERRIAYVAMTRAKDHLFLSDAQGFTSSKQMRYPSRFIFNIDKKLLNYITEIDEQFLAKSKTYIENSIRKMQLNQEILEKSRGLKIGDIIEHKVFGKGKIMEIDHVEKVYVINFDHIATPRRIVMNFPLKRSTGKEV